MNHISIVLCLLLVSSSQPAWAQQESLQHDAEHYILLRQHAQKWADEDREIDAKLADIRAENGGKSPNIVYILLDDLGFGEIGMPSLDVIRGYSTPNIDRLAREGMSFSRMYTEPTCTPTRAAMMTGRYAVRTGTDEAKTIASGEGLSAWEVTLAEVLSRAGYATVHIGKWHLGDIEEAYAFNQGFDYAEHPMHQQGQMGIMNATAELEGLTAGQLRNLRADTFESVWFGHCRDRVVVLRQAGAPF